MFKEQIQKMLSGSARVKEQMIKTCTDDINRAAVILIKAISGGNKILWCGNGGSAADAQHMSTELLGGLRDHGRKAIASLALTTDTSFITAWTNDTDYETVFSRQIEGLGLAGDVLIAISTSGNSANVIQAVKSARIQALKTIILTGGEGGKLKNMGDVVITIPSFDTQRIQEGHMAAEHILCELAEASLSK
ncbi:MAG: SIS domain-containing protein [Candidatus Neomarinimicrobiota bacterium]